MKYSGIHDCPIGRVQWVIRRGKIYIEPHPLEDVALHAIEGDAPCTCGDLKKRLIESERKRGIPRLKQRPSNTRPTFWKPLKNKRERRRHVLQVLPRASMPELVRYLVPHENTECWVRTVRRAGLANRFCCAELGEGVAYVVTLYGTTRPNLLRALVIARVNTNGTVGARVAFIEREWKSGNGPLTSWKEIPSEEVNLVELVQARMSLPDVRALKRFAAQEAQTPTRTPW